MAASAGAPPAADEERREGPPPVEPWSTARKATLWLCSPVLLALALVAVAILLVWFVLFQLATAPVVLLTVGGSIGIIVSFAVGISDLGDFYLKHLKRELSGDVPYHFRTSMLDLVIVGLVALLLLAVTKASGVRKRDRQLFARMTHFLMGFFTLYAIAKTAAYCWTDEEELLAPSGEDSFAATCVQDLTMTKASAVALVVLSFVSAVFSWLSGTESWTSASHDSLLRAERRLLFQSVDPTTVSVTHDRLEGHSFYVAEWIGRRPSPPHSAPPHAGETAEAHVGASVPLVPHPPSGPPPPSSSSSSSSSSSVAHAHEIGGGGASPRTIANANLAPDRKRAFVHAASPAEAEARVSEAEMAGECEHLTLVLCHGYGAGAGFWAHSLEHFARKFRRVICVDWYGAGGSDRVPWSAKNVEESESFFLEPFSQWLVALDRYLSHKHHHGHGVESNTPAGHGRHHPGVVLNHHHHNPGHGHSHGADTTGPSQSHAATEDGGLGPMVLGGHSMGGYLVGVFTLRLLRHWQEHHPGEVLDEWLAGKVGASSVVVGAEQNHGPHARKTATVIVDNPVSHAFVDRPVPPATTSASAAATASASASASAPTAQAESHGRSVSSDRSFNLREPLQPGGPEDAASEAYTHAHAQAHAHGHAHGSAHGLHRQLGATTEHPYEFVLRRLRHLLMISPVGIPTPTEEMANPTSRPLVLALFRFLWECNATPMRIVRFLGPFGPTLVHKLGTWRFARLSFHPSVQPLVDFGAINDYLYQIFALPGSGEFALNRLLAPGAWAREPLGARMIHSLRPEIPTSWFYGSHDWMRFEGGVEVCERVSAKWTADAKEQALLAHLPAGETPRRLFHAQCDIVEKSGHHLYFENPDQFCGKVLREVVLGARTRRRRLLAVRHAHDLQAVPESEEVVAATAAATAAVSAGTRGRVEEGEEEEEEAAATLAEVNPTMGGGGASATEVA